MTPTTIREMENLVDPRCEITAKMRGFHRWQPEAVEALAVAVGAMVAASVRSYRDAGMSWDVRNVGEAVRERANGAADYDILELIDAAEERAAHGLPDDTLLPVVVEPSHVTQAVALIADESE